MKLNDLKFEATSTLFKITWPYCISTSKHCESSHAYAGSGNNGNGNGGKSVNYIIDFNDGINPTLSTTIDFKGKSIFGIDIMTAAADQSFVDGTQPAYNFQGTYFGQFTGYAIDCINSGSGFKCDACDNFPIDCFFWSLKRNDESAQVGVSLLEFNDGDTLIWNFKEYVSHDP